MRISILCVGKIKEKFYKDAIAEYTKRLSRYASVSVVEVEDEKTPDGASDIECDNIKKKEADRLLKAMEKCGQSYVITLEIDGKNLSSEEMADKIQKLGVDGVSHIVFVIGGSLGLHESVTKKADMHLSFSRMTFPHQLMRVILLEQIYRSFRIISGEPYHK